MQFDAHSFHEHDTWDEGDPYDDYEVGPEDECEPELPGRPYCANCGRLKGSRQGRFYPDKACKHCGSTKTVLRNKANKVISWSKWLKIKADRRDEEYYALCALESGDGVESDYW